MQESNQGLLHCRWFYINWATWEARITWQGCNISAPYTAQRAHMGPCPASCSGAWPHYQSSRVCNGECGIPRNRWFRAVSRHSLWCCVMRWLPHSCSRKKGRVCELCERSTHQTKLSGINTAASWCQAALRAMPATPAPRETDVLRVSTLFFSRCLMLFPFHCCLFTDLIQLISP